MFKGIDHLDITVEDPEEMASFLIKLGFQEIRRTGGSRGSIELRFPGGDHQPLLELTPARRSDGSKLPLGLRHIALRCENIDEEFKTLSAKGIPFFDTEPRIVPDTGRRLANIKGPEGRFLQMVGRVSDPLRRAPAPPSVPATPSGSEQKGPESRARGIMRASLSRARYHSLQASFSNAGREERQQPEGLLRCPQTAHRKAMKGPVIANPDCANNPGWHVEWVGAIPT